MRTRIPCIRAAIRSYGVLPEQRVVTTVIIAALAIWVLVAPSRLFAQNVAMESAAAPGTDPGAPPVAESGNVNFFSQDLGSLVRLRYNTESYGQDGQGNFDIGSMQVITMEDTAAVLDGQVTMNDTDGVGFNVGVGYRWMNFPFYSASTGRVDGVAVWADGTHTAAGNFFPQIGVSYESLGESWDVRGNMYIPVGPQDKIGDFRPTGQIGFQGNSISQLTQAIKDSSLTVGELEVARRLGAGRDAWAFAGPYFLTNDDENSAGYRVGVRGYAFPDLLVQLAVSDDDLFKTYATFQVQWFVGRTRSNFQNTCGVPDRMREPFMRNDYVALRKSTVAGGNALTNANGDPLRIVHFDSDAAAGGNGTFEHPYNELNEGNGGNSQEGDILFAHSTSNPTSVFTTGITLKNNQRLLGEGNNLEQTVVTKQEGTLTIPESSPGARALAQPTINIADNSAAIALADNNEVSNFKMDGQNLAATRAIEGLVANNAGNPNLNHLNIVNAGEGITFSPATITDTNDLDNDNNKTEQFVRGNVTINNVTFDNVAGDDINIDSFTTTDITNANVTLQETIAITDVTSTNGGGAGVRLQRTHSAGTATLTNYTNGNDTPGSGGGSVGQGVLRFEGTTTDMFAGDVTINNADIKNNIGFAFDFLNVGTTTTVTLGTNSSYDGGTGAAGGLRANNFDGTLNASNTTFTNGTLSGLSVLGDSDGTFNFETTATFKSIDGTTIDIDGTDGTNDMLNGTISVLSDITNDTGRSVSIQNITTGATVTLNGDITDSGQGILVNGNSGGAILFGGDLNLDTTTFNAVTLADNATTTIDFPGKVDITTTSGNGFEATGGGTLTVSGATNSISTTTGQVAKITGMTISTPGNARFADVSRGNSAATNAIQVENNTGGSIDFGLSTDNAGEGGTIAGGTADAILIRNSANVSVNGVRINNGANAVSGVVVDKTNTTPMTVTLGGLETNGGDMGVEVTGHGTSGNLNLVVEKTAINGPTDFGLSFDNVDAGTITVRTNTTIDGNHADAGSIGVQILNSDATFTFDNTTAIRDWGTTDFDVNGGNGTISFAGSIVNSSTVNSFDTSGRSVRVHNVTGGNTTFTAASTINDDNQGWLVDNNQGGSVNFNGTNTLNTGTADAITLTSNDGATIAMTNLNIDTTDGQGLVATGGGSLTVSGLSNTIARTSSGTTGSALQIEGMTIGAVDFESVNATKGAHGIRLVDNTGGTITVGDTGNSAGQGGTITGTADAGVHATNSNFVLNGVNVANAGDAANEDAVEIFHTNSTTMNATMNRLAVTNATAARDGVTIDGTGGSGTFNANVQNMTVNVTGNGFVAQTGVTLQAGGTNTIQTATGTGLSLTDVAINNSGANFQKVGVSGGTSNGIVMTNVTGGQVAITGTGTTDNSGGSITTSGGDGIVLNNVTNVDLKNMQIISASGQGVNIDHTVASTAGMDVTIANLDLNASTGNGINVASANNTQVFALRLNDSTIQESVVMSHNAAGRFGVLLDNNNITTSGTDVAFSLAFSGSAQDGDVTIQNNNSINAADASALAVTVSGANSDVEFMVDNATFSNNSNTARTVDILVNGGATLNANVVNNTITNSGTAEEYRMVSDGSSTVLNLNLDNNAAGVFNLTTQNQGVPTVDFNFNVVDRDNVATNNTGTVNFNPATNQFKDISPPVEAPNGP